MVWANFQNVSNNFIFMSLSPVVTDLAETYIYLHQSFPHAFSAKADDHKFSSLMTNIFVLLVKRWREQ